MASSSDLHQLFAGSGENDAPALSSHGVLKPFSGIVQTRSYRLSPFLGLDPFFLRKAICTVLGSPVKKFVSYSNLGSRMVALVSTPGDGRGLAAPDFHEGFRETLAEVFAARIRQDFRSPEKIRILRESGSELLASGLWPALRQGLASVPVAGLRAVARENLWLSLLYTWSCVRLGERDRLEDCHLLLRLLPQAIPIGELMEDPGAWLVLTA